MTEQLAFTLCGGDTNVITTPSMLDKGPKPLYASIFVLSVLRCDDVFTFSQYACL